MTYRQTLVSGHLIFPDWLSVQEALTFAYKEMGLERELTDSGSQFAVRDWNIAGLVHGHTLSTQGTCQSCSTPLNYSTVIRCLDCRATLCQTCAGAHFGPEHSGRATAAHGGTNNGPT